MSKNFFSTILSKTRGPALPIVLILTVLAGGCVSRGTYNDDVRRLADTLRAEREAHEREIEGLKARVGSRGQSLSEVTNRYIEIQRDYRESQARLNNLRGDMMSLLRDIEELRMVVRTNFSGMQANEMLFKLEHMEDRVKNIMETDSEYRRLP